MNTIQKRFLLFLIACIGTRSLLVYIAKNIDTTYLQVFGDKIWWNDLRPIHGLLYLLFAGNAIMGNKSAWMYLLVDVLIGLVSFLTFHYNNGDFTKLLQ